MSKTVKIFIPLFLMILILTSYVAPFVKTSENISNEVFRLHILANSDTNEDQSLKLKVRDEILKSGESLFINCNSLDEIISVSSNNVDYFKNVAENCIRENGYNYNVNVYVDKEYFNTRKYDKITLPSGIYNALKIEIGEAKGHNWWCVMFPAICLSAVSDEEIYEILDEDEIKLINSNEKYEFRFKIVEIYSKLKDKIREINKSAKYN